MVTGSDDHHRRGSHRVGHVERGARGIRTLMLVKIIYTLGGKDEAELMSWENEDQRRLFEERLEDIVRRGGRVSIDAHPSHRSVIMSTGCLRCRALFMSSKCPVCGWVVGTPPAHDTDNPWAEEDETPLEKGKGRSR